MIFLIFNPQLLNLRQGGLLFFFWHVANVEFYGNFLELIVVENFWKADVSNFAGVDVDDFIGVKVHDVVVILHVGVVSGRRAVFHWNFADESHVFEFCNILINCGERNRGKFFLHFFKNFLSCRMTTVSSEKFKNLHFLWSKGTSLLSA